MATVREAIRTVLEFPLEKVSNQKTSPLVKFINKLLIGGLTVGSLSAYGFYAHHYFKSRKTPVANPQDNQSKKVSKATEKVLPKKQGDLTTLLESETTLTESLVDKLSWQAQKTSNIENYQQLNDQEKKYIHQVLLSYHNLFEEINKDIKEKEKDWQPDPTHTYETPYLTAQFVVPGVVDFKLKQEVSPQFAEDLHSQAKQSNMRHTLNILLRGYMPNAHPDIFGISPKRAGGILES